VDLVYFVLCAFGLTQILVYGTIFSSLRRKIEERSEWFGALFNCPMCTGFWVGVFLCGINSFTELFNFELNVINLFLLGCLSSGTSYVLCAVFGDNGVKHEFIRLDE